MESFRIAAAQSSSIRGDIEANVHTHVQFVQIAVDYSVNVIVFPELSLTGYEPEIAHNVVISLEDKRLIPLKEQAKQFGITIMAGAPINNRHGKPYLGTFVLGSNESITYIKNYLHPGEEKYFSEGLKKSCIVNVRGEKVGVAICADVNHPSHVEATAKEGATIYAAGVLMMNGYGKAIEQLRHYAIKYSMIVAMANYGAMTGGYVPAGKSAIWDQNGKRIAEAGEKGNAMVIGIRKQNEWTGMTIKI